MILLGTFHRQERCGANEPPEIREDRRHGKSDIPERSKRPAQSEAAVLWWSYLCEYAEAFNLRKVLLDLQTLLSSGESRVKSTNSTTVRRSIEHPKVLTFLC